MATKKVKRYNGEDGSMVDQDAADQEATSMMKRGMAEDDSKALPAGYKVEPEAPAKARMQSGPGRKPSTPAAKPAVKSAPSGVPSTGAGLRAMENAMASKAASAPKDMYRGFDGKMREKAASSDSLKGVRESIGSGLKSAGESVGSYLKSLSNREEKHGTYRDSSGKVVKYASGGSVSASSRADGIATKGKTRGKIC